jgi:hypothetical protein
MDSSHAGKVLIESYFIPKVVRIKINVNHRYPVVYSNSNVLHYLLVQKKIQKSIKVIIAITLFFQIVCYQVV